MADQVPKNGARARGRARGRARPAAAQAQQAQARPGELPRPATVTAPAPAPGPPPMGSGGRQMHRGVPRADTVPRPGEQPRGDIVQRMEGLSVQPQMLAGRASRRFEPEEVVHTRPAQRELVSKQAQGDIGRTVKLLTNYFELLSRPQWVVYQYHVDFSPVVESSRMRRALLGDHRKVLGECYLFDGMSDLKSVVKLQQEITELYSQRRTDNENIRIQVKRTAELAPDNPQLGHLFNTQMRRNLQHLQYQLIGRHYFDKDTVTTKPSIRLQIWQGIVTSVRMQERKLLMSVDTIHKIVRQETAWDILSEVSRKTPQQEFRNAATKKLVGSIVMTRYNTRTYRIDEISWDENPNSKFQSKTGELCYMEYYRTQYSITIQDVRQPLLLCTSKEREIRAGEKQSKRIMLVPELCLMTGLTDEMRANFTTMREIANDTKLPPNQRVANLQTFIDKINRHPDIQREMKAWDLSFSNSLVSLEGHVLPDEVIVQQRATSKYDPASADFSKQMRGKAMHVPQNLHSWMVICPGKERNVCIEFLQTLNIVCVPMGMRTNKPNTVYIDNDRIGTYTEAFKVNVTSDTQMVVFIVPNNKKDRYDALKKLTCLEVPVPSQVIVVRTLSKKQMLMSVCTKIGIQLNCKLGGEPWCVHIPFKMKVMIVGYDTYHDSSQRGRSAGGFVASMNSTFTRWYSRVNFHSASGWQELSDNLNANLTAALRKFREVNGEAPKLIIFYRDGVGDGQIRYVLDWEVKQMETCLNKVLGKGLYARDNPDGVKCAFIVVNKRISTRFFKQDERGICNPEPGTAVDDVVTRYERYDFFLVSQSVRQGTVAPTMYNIIKDCTGLQPLHMQRLSYKLTHLYFNWPGTVRVPAPCQYAHKLAFLSGQSLHREPHENLSDTLFYL